MGKARGIKGGWLENPQALRCRLQSKWGIVQLAMFDYHRVNPMKKPIKDHYYPRPLMRVPSGDLTEKAMEKPPFLDIEAIVHRAKQTKLSL